MTEETPRETTQAPREMQTPQQEAQMPQQARIKKVSLEVSRKVSLQMSSPFPRQELPHDLTRHWPQHLTYYLPRDPP